MESSHDFDPLTYALKGCPKILSEDLRIIQKVFNPEIILDFWRFYCRKSTMDGNRISSMGLE